MDLFLVNCNYISGEVRKSFPETQVKEIRGTIQQKLSNAVKSSKIRSLRAATASAELY